MLSLDFPNLDHNTGSVRDVERGHLARNGARHFATVTLKIN